MDHRELFRSLVKALERTTQDIRVLEDTATKEYHAAVLYEAETNPKTARVFKLDSKLSQLEGKANSLAVRRRTPVKNRTPSLETAFELLPADLIFALQDKHMAAIQKERDELRARKARIDTLLDRVAVKAKVVPGEVEHVLDTIWSSSYNSQGHSAGSYAKGAAENLADVARSVAIPVEVVKTSLPSSLPFSVHQLEQYAVKVSVKEPLDIEILKRKPAPSLKEQIRLCWKRGVNPRVYNPFIPFGIEAKLGLDFVGGYSDKTV